MSRSCIMHCVTVKNFATRSAADKVAFPKYVTTCLEGLRSYAQARSLNAADLKFRMTDLLAFIILNHRETLISRINAICCVFFDRKDGCKRLCDWTAPQSDEDNPDIVLPSDSHYSPVLEAYPAFKKQTDPAKPDGSRHILAAKNITAFRDVLRDLLDTLRKDLDVQLPDAQGLLPATETMGQATRTLVTIYRLMRATPHELWWNRPFVQILASKSTLLISIY